MKRPIVFFTHHQGRGHAQRAAAIARHVADRKVIVLTARPDFLDGHENIETVALPDMIGKPCATDALFAIPSPPILHCTPVGVPEMRGAMRTIADTLDECDAGLFVVDVSAEIALLGRIMSVPVVTVRLHGDRSDPGHMAALEASTAVLAPFDRALEQPDYPGWAACKTHYTGGLCIADMPVAERDRARQTLGLASDRTIIVVLAGGGGSGTPLAPITLAARVEPDSLFIIVGPVHREGHETAFANIVEAGWCDNVTDYLAAADLVISSAGDNSVHEIARVGRPFLCIPEWRYFGEQKDKAAALARTGAAVHLATWPSSPAEWEAALADTRALDVTRLARLQNDDAARNAAAYLCALADRLWDDTRVISS